MALTADQINDSIFLSNMINQLNNQRRNIIAEQENAHRENEQRFQQNLRQMQQNNKINGAIGGLAESIEARLRAGRGQGAADINNQYGTLLSDNAAQIAEYQAYLDAYNQRMAELAALNAGASGGGGGGRGKSVKDPLSLTPTQNTLGTADRAVGSNVNRVPYTSGGYTSTSLPMRNVEMTDTGTSARNPTTINNNSLLSSVGSTVKSAAPAAVKTVTKKSNTRYVK